MIYMSIFDKFPKHFVVIVPNNNEQIVKGLYEC